MSVLSRPVRHHATAPTQREVRIPLPRTSPEPEAPAQRPSPQITQPAPTSGRRTRTIMLVGGGLAVALAVGVGAYALVDDGGSTTVIAPSVANVPSDSDLALDRAMAARNPANDSLPAVSTAVTQAERQAAQAQRLRNSGNDAAVFSPLSDAERLSEAQRDAALAQRAQNVTP